MGQLLRTFGGEALRERAQRGDALKELDRTRRTSKYTRIWASNLCEAVPPILVVHLRRKNYRVYQRYWHREVTRGGTPCHRASQTSGGKVKYITQFSRCFYVSTTSVSSWRVIRRFQQQQQQDYLFVILIWWKSSMILRCNDFSLKVLQTAWPTLWWRRYWD